MTDFELYRLTASVQDVGAGIKHQPHEWRVSDSVPKIKSQRQRCQQESQRKVVDNLHDLIIQFPGAEQTPTDEQHKRAQDQRRRRTREKL